MQVENIERRRLIDRIQLDSVTLGISLRDCSSRLSSTARARIYDKIRRAGGQFPRCVQDTLQRYGSSVQDLFATVTPLATVFDGLSQSDYVGIAETMESAAIDIGLTAIGGYSALCSAGVSAGDEALIRSLPGMVSSTKRVSASVECATSRRGTNVPATDLVSAVLTDSALQSMGVRDRLARIAVLANASGNSPFLPGAFHGIDEPEVSLHIGVSSDHAFTTLLQHLDAGASLDNVAEDVAGIMEGLRRGGYFLGTHCAQTLSARSGLKVHPGRVEVTIPIAGSPSTSPDASYDRATDELAARNTLMESLAIACHRRDASGHPSGSPATPVQGRRLMLDPETSSRNICRTLIRHLAEAVNGGFEMVLSIESSATA